MHDQSQLGTGRSRTFHIKGFSTVDIEGLARGAFLELQGHNAHSHQVSTVNALKSFSGNGFNTRQSDTFRCPITGRALTVVSTGDDDQRLFSLHVGFDGFPHASDLAFRLDARQGALLHFAVFIQHHFVEQFRVGEGGSLCGQMIAAVGRVGVEVDLRHTHFVQIFTGGAVHHDGVGRRQVICRDVVWQHGQRAHAFEHLLADHAAFPVWWATDVSTHLAPVIQGIGVGLRIAGDVEHGNVGAAELLRLHRLFHDGVDFGVIRPDVLQGDGVSVFVVAQRIFFDIEADGSCNRVGHYQRR